MQSLIAAEQDFTMYALSEYAVTLEFSAGINEATAELVSRFHILLMKQAFPGFHTSVPAYNSLTVIFDPMLVSQAADLPGTGCLEKVSVYLRRSMDLLGQAAGVTTAKEPIPLPVCYGGSYGPDLEEVARLHGLTSGEVIRLHSSAIYRVFMIGFVPGFAYLGGLDDRLETARRGSPRQVVPAGSVGIAGKQTGIYSLETPGGWQIIGRTPLRMFDANREEPALLKGGDRVLFTAISEREFERYEGQHAGKDR